MKTQDTYKSVKTIQFPGIVVRVYSPILTEEERLARMKNIHTQAANLLRKVQ